MDERWRTGPHTFTRRRLLRLSGVVAAGGLLSACQLWDSDDSRDDTGPTAVGTGVAGQEPTATATVEPVQSTQTASPTELPATPTATVEPSPTATPEPEPVTFRIVRPFPVVSMNPYVTAPGRAGIAARLCLEPLFDFGPELEPVLVLARTWPTVENGLLAPDLTRVVWELRDDVLWHDGRPFTAEDVRATWQFILDAPTWDRNAIAGYHSIEEIEVLDDHAVRLRFAGSNPAWINLFRGVSGVILPAHIFRDLDPHQAMRWQEEANQTPVGTGPWHAVELVPAGTGHAHFERNAHYYREIGTNIEAIEIRWGGDALSVARNVLQTGEADWATQLTASDPREFESIEPRSGGFVTVPTSAVERLIFNFVDPASTDDPVASPPSTPHPVLSDRRVREAIALAIPRERIADEAWGLAGEPAYQTLPLHEHMHHEPFPAQDIERARTLVEEAGHGGARLRIHSTRNGVRELELELIAEALEEVGFVVETRHIDAGVFFSFDLGHPDSYSRFDADIMIYTHGPGQDPYPLDWAVRYRSDRQLPDPARHVNDTAANIARYSNPEYDRLHDQLQRETDPAEQGRLWGELLGILRADIVEVPLVHRLDVMAAGDRVQNWSLNPWAENPSWDVHGWKIDSRQ